MENTYRPPKDQSIQGGIYQPTLCLMPNLSIVHLPPIQPTGAPDLPYTKPKPYMHQSYEALNLPCQNTPLPTREVTGCRSSWATPAPQQRSLEKDGGLLAVGTSVLTNIMVPYSFHNHIVSDTSNTPQNGIGYYLGPHITCRQEAQSSLDSSTLQQTARLPSCACCAVKVRKRRRFKRVALGGPTLR